MPKTLIAAIVTITAALICYTIGVFSERKAKVLKPIHLVFFWAGLVFDTTGTTLMSTLASSSESRMISLHGITGMIAIVLMLIHALWATFVIVKKNEKIQETFHRFSLFVWIVWLIPLHPRHDDGNGTLSLKIYPLQIFIWKRVFHVIQKISASSAIATTKNNNITARSLPGKNTPSAKIPPNSAKFFKISVKLNLLRRRLIIAPTPLACDIRQVMQMRYSLCPHAHFELPCENILLWLGL